MSSSRSESHATTVRDLLRAKEEKRRIVAVTAYDALFARLIDEAGGVDVVLVGDSVNQVIAGENTTLSATVDQMIYHGKMVRRGLKKAMLVIDMPFLSYQVSVEDAVRNCGRVMKETGAQAVKLEGGAAMAPAVHACVEIGIPVMGHVGLTPQSVHALSGYRVQGRDDAGASRMEADALALEEAGAFAVVLELVPAELAKRISQKLRVPTIGIGAGIGCDGQVLVTPDLLGLNDAFNPKFLKRYARLADEVRRAIAEFSREVHEGKYPGPEHSF